MWKIHEAGVVGRDRFGLWVVLVRFLDSLCSVEMTNKNVTLSGAEAKSKGLFFFCHIERSGSEVERFILFLSY